MKFNSLILISILIILFIGIFQSVVIKNGDGKVVKSNRPSKLYIGREKKPESPTSVTGALSPLSFFGKKSPKYKENIETIRQDAAYNPLLGFDHKKADSFKSLNADSKMLGDTPTSEIVRPAVSKSILAQNMVEEKHHDQYNPLRGDFNRQETLGHLDTTFTRSHVDSNKEKMLKKNKLYRRYRFTNNFTSQLHHFQDLEIREFEIANRQLNALYFGEKFEKLLDEQINAINTYLSKNILSHEMVTYLENCIINIVDSKAVRYRSMDGNYAILDEAKLVIRELSKLKIPESREVKLNKMNIFSALIDEIFGTQNRVNMKNIIDVFNDTLFHIAYYYPFSTIPAHNRQSEVPAYIRLPDFSANRNSLTENIQLFKNALVQIRTFRN